MKKQGEAKLGLEGSEEGRWILIDYGDFVVHIFSPETGPFTPSKRSGAMPRSSTGKTSADRAGDCRRIRPARRRDDRHHESTRSLAELFVLALPEGADRAAFAKAVRPATDPKFGDYQANGCMALAKALGRKAPRSRRRRSRARVDLAPIAGPPEVAGPGVLNLRLERCLGRVRHCATF